LISAKMSVFRSHLPLNPAQDLAVYIERAERDQASDQDFPCCPAEFPSLLHGHTDRVEHEKEEQTPVDRPEKPRKFRTGEKILHRHPREDEDKQRDALQPSDDPQSSDLCFQ